jgi:hypothetical protein
LEARALFSKQPVSHFLDPGVSAPRSPLERHHLFPSKYLKTLGITDRRELNQVANFTVLEWGDNADISDIAPSEYLKEMSVGFSGAELKEMFRLHALPPGWESMKYPEFLQKRRELMAVVISEAYDQLTVEQAISDSELDVPFVVANEGMLTEYKATLRTNLHTGQKDARMEFAVLKTIAAFLNSNGGQLLIGVADDGTPSGIAKDQFENEDKMNLHLVNLVRDKIGAQHALSIQPHFEDMENERVMVIKCEAAKTPVYLKENGTERFYVRSGAASLELAPSQQNVFIRNRFS